ncbi:MAG: ABC transporter permease [Candidatus Babeliales bacterium]|nr:ABC transporter permease [Candidatus Babeliales bacterium]
MHYNTQIFIQFTKRDIYVFSKNIIRYFINYSIIFPSLYALTFGYIIPTTSFSNVQLVSISLLLPSSLIFLFLSLNFNQNIFLLLDLENNKYIEFQTLLLNPRLLIIQKVFVTSSFTTIFLLPFFGVTKLILQNSFDTSQLSIFKLVTIIFFSSIAAASYVILSILYMHNTHQIGNWWRRMNTPLTMLGGTWVPWATMAKVSVILGYITLFNPFIYITEGLRGAILGTDLFIPFHYCILALTIFTFIFINLAIRKFKKRLDCF